MIQRHILQSGLIKRTFMLLVIIPACALASHVPDEIIVKFKPDIPSGMINEIISQYDCSSVEKCDFADLHLLQVPESQTPEQMISTYQNLEYVEYAELNYHFKILLVPNDDLYYLQWNLYNDIYGGINIEEAWDIQTGNPNVIIAVLDTGVAYQNYGIYRKAPDLELTRFVPGYDFVNDDSHPNDDQGHGTHVAGTIAQSTNNILGTAGVAFGCSVMPVKVIGNDGVGTVFDIVDGIYYATENGANVINMSIGADSDSVSLRRAVQYAYSNGVTIVCAAGNNFEKGNLPIYPAAYDQYCIAVGATRFDETRAYYSNTGTYIDIAAPGGDLGVDQNADNNPDGILQQTFNGQPDAFNYWFSEGTSSATPHVSGAAALLISNGVTKPDKVRQAIEQSTDDIGPIGWDPEYGWGLLNVQKALNYRFTGDLDGDFTVGIYDLDVFCDYWLAQDSSLHEVDFNNDGIVNFLDFAVMINNWSQ